VTTLATSNNNAHRIIWVTGETARSSDQPLAVLLADRPTELSNGTKVVSSNNRKIRSKASSGSKGAAVLILTHPLGDKLGSVQLKKKRKICFEINWS
jgi:hypothetical protein